MAGFVGKYSSNISFVFWHSVVRLFDVIVTEPVEGNDTLRPKNPDIDIKLVLFIITKSATIVSILLNSYIDIKALLYAIAKKLPIRIKLLNPDIDVKALLSPIIKVLLTVVRLLNPDIDVKSLLLKIFKSPLIFFKQSNTLKSG